MNKYVSKIFMITVLMWAAGTAFAAQQGEYFLEDQYAPEAGQKPEQIPSLLFSLRCCAGIAVDANGAVRTWADPTKPDRTFTAVAKADAPARRVENVLAGKPAVSFTAAQHRAGGLRSSPVKIDPAQGMTLFVLARVTAPENGRLLSYGDTYKTAGSLAISLKGLPSYNRAVAQTHMGDGSPALVSTSGNVYGKGFVLFATRFDPGTGEQTLYENGFEVGRATRAEPLASSHPFAVGVSVGGTGSMSGDVLAALAYNRALSKGELRAVTRSLFAEFGLGVGNTVSSLAPLLPYAYYPSRNQMEVAVELNPERLAKAQGGDQSAPVLKEVKVRVLESKSGQEVAVGMVPLDGQARGQAVFDVPDLPDGEYAVEYVIGKHVERSAKTFKRIHFPFEKTDFGKTHEVYPPFEPVKVNGKTVSVVGRTYTVNAFGLFDSVTSLGRELLATPMRLISETADGKQMEWQKGDIKGRGLYPDEALFETETQGSGIKVQSSVTVNEDGCAKIAMTLMPDTKKPVTVSRLYIDIPLKDSEVPFFHYVADNGIRFNYGGKTPRGGKIEWYAEKWDGQVPQRWRVAAPGSDDGVLWTSADTRQPGNPQAWDHRPFVPYLWLGAEERGLAFFMENENGFATDYRTPLQQVVRKGDQVVIRVEIFQQPVTLSTPRTITFGLMASPGKPLEKEFRARPFASGVGPVVCWGGWKCSSKYPDNQDWSIVDKIQEIRKNGKMTKDDQAWLDAKYEEVKNRWPDRRMHDDPKAQSWLWLTNIFAQRAASEGRTHSGVYFEEHNTDARLPEWEVFQDEWSNADFNRFRDKPVHCGVFSPSYHNFVLYMANEWMRRGVSLYFDNTNPKRCYNERFGPAYRTPDGTLVYGISIFAQRDYYRRIYKLLREWNARGAEYPIDFTLHITNTQTLPLNTWATATLDLEQRAQTEDPEKVPPEVVIAKKDENSKAKPEGFQLPWPPDYTRTVTLGRQAGAIPLALDFVSGHGRHDAAQYTPQMMLRDWAMRRIHDIRPGADYMKSAALTKAYEKILIDFGYGQTERVAHHNYWKEKPFVTVGDDRIKWLALEQKSAIRGQRTEDRGQNSKVSGQTGVSAQKEKTADTGTSSLKTDTLQVTPDTSFALLLLQSYSRTEAIKVPVIFPGAAVFQDVETKEIIPAPNGKATIAMPANFGTRMFRIKGQEPTPKESAQP